MDIGIMKTTSADGIMMTSSVVTHKQDDNQLVSTVKHSGMICQDDVQSLSILHSPHSVTKDMANKTHDMLDNKYSAKVVNIGTPKLTKVKARQQESDEITTNTEIGTRNHEANFHWRNHDDKLRGYTQAGWQPTRQYY